MDLSILDDSPAPSAALPFAIQEKLAALEAALTAQNPEYATILATIHKETALNPSFVYSLSEEEMAVIVRGYERYKGISIDVGKISKKQGTLLDADAV